MKVRHNIINITSLITFANIKGGVNQTCKDVYFIRCIGTDKNYLNDIRDIDRLLTDRENNNQGKYTRVMELPRLVAQSEILFYANAYDEWMKSKSEEIHITLKNKINGKSVEQTLIEALKSIFQKYTETSQNISDSMQKNFIIKIVYWLDTTAGQFLEDWKERESYKYIYSGIIKKHEFLFLYLLTLIGIDVLILNPESELNLEAPLLNLSYKLQLETCSKVTIPAYEKSIYKGDRLNTDYNNQINVEKGFEELALLASSIVMISVHNENKEIIGTGSGIMVSSKGYILTNCHVISGGSLFLVRIEGEEDVYETDEVIKYNWILDLALLRINKKLKPIPIYGGDKELARGQKVVAIGSPLGLFNSVSDGIISGFRTIDDVWMIQFTAPISHGSSGGAVLNMYGEVIGISTAGIDQGQNINLAVGYENINSFVKGFL